MLDRLNAYYLDKGIHPDVLDAVLSTKPTKPLDINNRLLAVDTFRKGAEAESLAAANKRIGNILKKVNFSYTPSKNLYNSANHRSPVSYILY